MYAPTARASRVLVQVIGPLCSLTSTRIALADSTASATIHDNVSVPTIRVSAGIVIASQAPMPHHPVICPVPNLLPFYLALVIHRFESLTLPVHVRAVRPRNLRQREPARPLRTTMRRSIRR